MQVYVTIKILHKPYFPDYDSITIIDHQHLTSLLTKTDDMITDKYVLGADNTINATEENINSSTQTPAVTTWDRWTTL